MVTYSDMSPYSDNRKHAGATMTENRDLHVVFGTGAIGTALIEELHNTGRRVRAVNTSGVADVPSGVELVGGDVTVDEFARAASDGAGVVYFCLGAPYTKWPELFPPLQAAVVAGASAAGARLVVLENLYMYGPTQGRPLTEDLAYSATTRKGTARAAMSQDLMTAHAAGDVQVVIGRASDYFGPRGLYSAMGERVFYPAIAGKKSRLAGKLDVPHTYSYLPDIARGLMVLGERDDALGRAWHLPNAETITTREFVEKVYVAAGNKPNMSGTPRFILKLVARKDPNVAEVIEMLYEFEEPFVVDDSQFIEAFGGHVTPLDEAIETTVEWFRANPEPEGR